VITPQSLPYIRRTLAVPLLLGSLLAACGGGGGGGGIPAVVSESEAPGATGGNDTTATADTVALGTPISGDISTAADIDYFKVNLTAGSVIELELCATRNKQSDWDAANNVPRLTLWDTDANANAKLQEQDFSGHTSDAWSWGKEDLDIPRFLVPATGTYFVSVTQDDTTLAGGPYVLRVHTVNVPNLQQEAEASGTDGANDTPATAETINPGTMHGYHVSGGFDYYKFTVSGPTTIGFEMTAYRNGPNRGDPNYYDTYIYLYDTDGTTELVHNDDTYFYDSAIQYRLTTAGTYYLKVREFSGANSEYFLTYTRSTAGIPSESEPNDDTAHADSISYGGRIGGTIDVGEVDFYRFQGTKGDMVRLQRFDNGNTQGAADVVAVTMLATDGTTPLLTGGDGNFQTFTTILQESGTFYIKVEPGVGLTDYALELTRFKSAAYESASNDSIATAEPLGTRRAGAIETVGDVDVYSFHMSANRLSSIVCYASDSTTDGGDFEYSGHGSDCEPLIEILDGNGTVVSSSTTTPVNSIFTESVTDPLPTCAICGFSAVSGTFYLRISDASGGGGPSFYYVLEKR